MDFVVWILQIWPKTRETTKKGKKRRLCERLEHLFRQTGIKVEPFDL